MAERKPTIPVVVENDEEKKIIADAAERAGYDNPGAYIRALLRRDGVSIRQQQRGGWRGERKEETASGTEPDTTSDEHSSLLCIETANTP